MRGGGGVTVNGESTGGALGSGGSSASAEGDTVERASGGAAGATTVVGDASGDSQCPPLEAYALSQEVTLPDIPAEASGIAYNDDTSTFMIVANLQGRLWEYDDTFEEMLRVRSLESNVDSDTEGLAYLGDGRLAVAAEDNRVYVDRLALDDTAFGGMLSTLEIYEPSAPPPVANAGIEGVAYRRPRDGVPGRLYVCQEYQPMRVLQFDVDSNPGEAGLRSVLDNSLVAAEPWDAELALSEYVEDLAGMVYDEARGSLLLVSQLSSLVLRVEPDTGRVTESLPLVNTSTSEGVALFDSCALAVVSEPNTVQIYRP